MKLEQFLKVIFTIHFNPLMPSGNEKVTHTSTNLQPKAADLLKYV